MLHIRLKGVTLEGVHHLYCHIHVHVVGRVQGSGWRRLQWHWQGACLYAGIYVGLVVGRILKVLVLSQVRGDVIIP